MGRTAGQIAVFEVKGKYIAPSMLNKDQVLIMIGQVKILNVNGPDMAYQCQMSFECAVVT